MRRNEKSSYRGAIEIAGKQPLVTTSGHSNPLNAWNGVFPVLTGIAYAGHEGVVTARVEKVWWQSSYDKVEGFRDVMTRRVVEDEQAYRVKDGRYDRQEQSAAPAPDASVDDAYVQMAMR